MVEIIIIAEIRMVFSMLHFVGLLKDSRGQNMDFVIFQIV